MADAEPVEIITLGIYDPETQRRDFDAVSYGRCYWRGRLDFVLWDQPKEGRIYVFSDRNDVLGDDYGMRPGTIDEVENDDRARQVIARAVYECFDHTTTVEAISDGNGGWIPLETDT
jgi:hypothetical protein